MRSWEIFRLPAVSFLRLLQEDELGKGAAMELTGKTSANPLRLSEV
jgi:hypothetical protein